MKKILLLLFFSFSLSAEATDYTNLLENNESYLIDLNETVTVDGSPLIYIEGKKPAHKKDNHPVLDNSMTLSAPIQQELNFTFETPFHRIAKAGLIDHIPDLATIIQLVDHETISIGEEIIQLNTKPDLSFSRRITLPEGASFELTKFVINGKHQEPAQIKLNDSDIILVSPDKMEIGPNKVHIRYLIKQPLKINETQALLNVHITGSRFPLPIDRLQAVVLFPRMATLFENQLFFGANKQLVPETFQTKQDTQGNVIYNFTHLIPAFTDIQTHLVFEKSVLPKEDLWERIFGSKLFFPCLLMITLLFYFGASVYWDTHKPMPSYLPAVLKKASPFRICALFHISNPLEYFNNLLIYNKNNKKINYVIHAYKSKLFRSIFIPSIRLITFFSIMGEMYLGTLLLIVLSAILASVFPISISLGALLIIAGLSSLILIVLYFMFLRPYHIRIIFAYTTLAMNMKNASLLSATQIGMLAPLMIATNQHIKWIDLLKKYNPHYIIQSARGEQK